MKKRTFAIARSRCSEVVESLEERRVSGFHNERFQQESFRPERYDRKKDNVIRKLKQSGQKQPVKRAVGRSSVRSWHPSTKVEPVSRINHHLDSLEALSYQARFSTQVSIRLEALEGLVMVDCSAESTLTTLEEALDDPIAEVRAKSAALLGESPSPLLGSIMDKLIHRAWDSEIVVRKAVALSLSNHPDPRSIGPLMGLLGTQDDELHSIVHQSLIDICKKLGPPPPRTDGDT